MKSPNCAQESNERHYINGIHTQFLKLSNEIRLNSLTVKVFFASGIFFIEFKVKFNQGVRNIPKDFII